MSRKARLGVVDKINTRGEIPDDGVYYRAPGVSLNLRSFPKGGPFNCHTGIFRLPDAITKKIPERILVPEEFRPWNVPYEGYNPLYYISQSTYNNCRDRNPEGYADPTPPISPLDPKFEKLFHSFNQIWLRGLKCGEDGSYLHPYGRVGITGQGTLGNRQINEAIDPVTVFFEPITREVKVLLIQRNPTDTNDTTWAVPGGMVDFKPENNSYTLPRALNKVYESMTRRITQEEHDSDSSLKENALRELKEETGFNSHVTYQKLIAQMYCDDSRTTDTTW
eukprot:CAMPEP_0182437094 /NCGR_PEP_ID=MMETSP1167-20130531/84812_1 /TAXON_ID=2988 /ORGANISM="Mallomonas Sp, Strain CCMP3275" /LENGTH=278 /DNA_ID=CAMNT_0024629889 /DNA_START=154 /DNA_END=987 /DNA_ORIENTATION=+